MACLTAMHHAYSLTQPLVDEDLYGHYNYGNHGVQESSGHGYQVSEASMETQSYHNSARGSLVAVASDSSSFSVSTESKGQIYELPSHPQPRLSNSPSIHRDLLNRKENTYSETDQRYPQFVRHERQNASRDVLCSPSSNSNSQSGSRMARDFGCEATETNMNHPQYKSQKARFQTFGKGPARYPSKPFIEESEKYPESTLKKNPLLTDAAQAVIEMGYIPKHVHEAVTEVLKHKAWDTMTSDDITNMLSRQGRRVVLKARNQNSNIKNKEYILKNDISSLECENKALKDRKLCKVCCEEDVSIVFLPCAHLVCCAQCAPAIQKCAICRKVVKGTVRVSF